MKLLKIKPNDNLFFGDGKRFDKGENTWLTSKLMPYPSVFKGAVASLMLKLNEKRKENYINNKDGESDPRKFLSIGKVYLYDEKNQDIYIPAPLDLFQDRRGKCKYGTFSKIGKHYTSSAPELEYVLFPPRGEKPVRADGLYIKMSTFYYSYIQTKTSIGFCSKEDIMSPAYKVGIQMDKDKGTAQEDHLYRIDSIEFRENKWSYLVEYYIEDTWWEGNDIKELGQGYLKLGGENKSCKYAEVTSDKLLENYSNSDNKSTLEFVKLYFFSPVIFNSLSHIPWDNNSHIKIVGASTGKPYYIGGFDIKKRKSKKMYKAVPEGSVYLLQIEGFKDKSLSEIKDEVKKLLLNSCTEMADTGYSKEDFKNFFQDGFGQFEIIPLSQPPIKGGDLIEI